MDNSDEEEQPPMLATPLPPPSRQRASPPSFTYEISDDDEPIEIHESTPAGQSNRPSFDFMSTIEKYKSLKEQFENGENVGSYACYFTQFGDPRNTRTRKSTTERTGSVSEEPPKSKKKKSWSKSWINKYRKGKK